MRKKNAKNAISRKIRSLRKAMGYVQSDYAKLLGIGTRTLASWEVGEIEPSDSKIKSLISICHKEAPEAVESHFNPAEWHYEGEFKNSSNRAISKLPMEEQMYRKKYEEKCERVEELSTQVIELQKYIIDAGLNQKKASSFGKKTAG